MTVERIDALTGEVIDAMSRAEARRLTTEAQSEFRSAVSHHDRGWQIVARAIQAGGHEVLGYRSASDYLEHEFAEVLAGLDVAGRRVAVRELSALGMSTRAIAPVVGVSKAQVSIDQRQVSSDWTPDPEPRVGGAPSRAQSESSDVEPREFGAPTPPAPRPAPVIGRDGKTYTRPEPAATPKRAPLPQQVQSAGWDLAKSVDRIKRLADDDRFTSHQKEVAPHLRSHLTHAIEVCQDLLDRINN